MFIFKLQHSLCYTENIQYMTVTSFEINMSSNKKIYFAAGPAKIPDEVMMQIHSELLNYKGSDISVLEMSHRSKEFASIIEQTETDLRKLIKVPDNYSILFMHGGAKTQFDAVPMNLCPELDTCTVDYIINGSWSEMAASEAKKYAKVNKQLLKSEKFNRVPRKEELVDVEEAVYRFYCDNETIQGLEFNYIPECGKPLVSDMTSNFLSRPIDVNKFGVIFAGAQKNCGIAGLAIVIVRNDLCGRHMKLIQKLQNYQHTRDQKSVYNTPLTFAIYVAGLCAKWMLERGGLEEMDRFSKEKSGLLYDAIDNSGGFYNCPVGKCSRSRMNVTFLLANNQLDGKFLEEAKQAGLYELKGHRSVGGFRASLYHGISVEDVKRLIRFMEVFKKKYS